MAYQTVDAVRAMEANAGYDLSELRADGGATVNRWLMQFQADVLGVPVAVAHVAQTTALGAGYLAGVGAGMWSPGDVLSRWRAGAHYEPRMSVDERQTLLAGWSTALAQAQVHGAPGARGGGGPTPP
jgi:glycerol kinase